MVAAETTTPINVAAPQRAKIFVPYLEGVRGVAAIYVVLYHVGENWHVPHLTIPPLLRYGHYAVAIFIVVSGYVLALPIISSGGFDPRSFFVRRARRLLPAYYTTLLASLPFWYFIERANGVHLGVKSFGVAILVHAVFLQDVSMRTEATINAPLWSVALEVQIYVIFALILVPTLFRFGMLAMLGAAFAIGFLPVVVGFLPHRTEHYYLASACPWFLLLFALGSAAAFIVHDDKPIFARILRTVPWWVVSLAFTVAFLVISYPQENERYEQLSDYFYWADICAGAAVAALFVSTGKSAASGRRAIVERVFGSRPLIFIGTFSYSIYLIHEPIVVSAMMLIGASVHSQPLFVALSYGLTIPIVGIAYLFYLRFEKPYLSSFRRSEDEGILK